MYDVDLYTCNKSVQFNCFIYFSLSITKHSKISSDVAPPSEHDRRCFMATFLHMVG